MKVEFDIEPELIDKLNKLAEQKHQSDSKVIAKLINNARAEELIFNDNPDIDNADPFVAKLASVEIPENLKAIIGIIPADVDVDQAKWEYLKEKYGS